MHALAPAPLHALQLASHGSHVATARPVALAYVPSGHVVQQRPVAVSKAFPASHAVQLVAVPVHAAQLAEHGARMPGDATYVPASGADTQVWP